MASVPYPIIGADVLAYYKLSIDLRNQKLIDMVSNFNMSCFIRFAPLHGVSAIDKSTPYSKISPEFPSIIGLPQLDSPLPSNVCHHIHLLISFLLLSPWVAPIHMICKTKSQFHWKTYLRRLWRCPLECSTNLTALPSLNIFGLDFVFSYIDDIPIALSSLEKSESRLRIVFRRLADASLRLNLSKCVIGVSQL